MSPKALGPVLLLVASVVAGACSAVRIPTTPDGVAATGTADTAAILGSLVTPSGAALPGVVVSVVGAGKAARTDSTGKFGLSRVPPGNLQLQFIGSGVDALLMLPGVTPTEMIDITIRLDGSSATIAASNRRPA